MQFSSATNVQFTAAANSLYWQRLGYFMLEHTSATTIGGFRSQPERCNNALISLQSGKCRVKRGVFAESRETKAGETDGDRDRSELSGTSAAR